MNNIKKFCKEFGFNFNKFNYIKDKGTDLTELFYNNKLIGLHDWEFLNSPTYYFLIINKMRKQYKMIKLISKLRKNNE